MTLFKRYCFFGGSEQLQIGKITITVFHGGKLHFDFCFRIWIPTLKETIASSGANALMCPFHVAGLYLVKYVNQGDGHLINY